MFVSKLCAYLNLNPDEFIRFLGNASVKYKVFKIPKRSHGYRIIAQPSKELKKYQRAFLKCYNLPAHSCATGYQKRLSIKDNARPHLTSKYLLKLDLENFFTRLSPTDFWRQCENHFSNCLSFPENEKILINQLLFWSPSKNADKKLVLSIGAPSSPSISNFCMFSFDKKIFDYCRLHSITYTRYADDLTFSSNEREQLLELIPVVKETLESEFEGKQNLKDEKTVLTSKANNRHITGLTLTADNRLSLGRKKKRFIKHLVHCYIHSLLSDNELKKLIGWLSFAQDVEPSFLISLERKYSPTIIKQIRSYRDVND